MSNTAADSVTGLPSISSSTAATYQVEYSRNLIFADGTTMQRLFDAVVDAQAVCTACPAFATAVDGWPA